MSTNEAPTAPAAGATMKALRLSAPVSRFDDSIRDLFSVEDVPVPTPKAGQVLVKVAYSTVNPSDTSYLQGRYGRTLTTPCGAGFEGSGTVVSSGGGFMAWRLVGSRVAFYSDAAWAEYAVVPATGCVPLLPKTPLRAGAGALVNPLTVLAFVELARHGGHRALVHTAGASSLGRMLIRQAAKSGVKVIAVVRREEQAETCRAEGAAEALVSTSESFAADLKEASARLGATIAFDAVAGQLTGQIVSAMPRNSTVHVYGGLAGEGCSGISPTDLIFQNKTVTGFWLTAYMKRKNIIGMIQWSRAVAQGIEAELASPIAREVSLHEGTGAFVDAVLSYVKNMSAGKVLIRCESAEEDGAAEGASSPADDAAQED